MNESKSKKTSLKSFLLLTLVMALIISTGCGPKPETEAADAMKGFFKACSARDTDQVQKFLNMDKMAENAVKRVTDAAKSKGKVLNPTIIADLKRMMGSTPEKAFYQRTPQQWDDSLKTLRVSVDSSGAASASSKDSPRIRATANDGSTSYAFYLENDSRGWRIVDFNKE
ncbi:MAG: hypothetical protein CVV64_12890 [Candidatus Wallbacteria bacterium HGW-Wallbacteria-1]|jgi:hypothetical protein|uniref:Uncharacterized protein n=1 Tax=Candidatus Wallbacteria bacterium HGW-Wallbacteria-1 TaxID=2013854 RepID=A0A2N1PMY5_9BACT|nr:MAG: hypothetical protein CVV64_12890 [Candidatus Wallbacteria bacterium HGW-Wallbacteria-1]